jgi:hypothetical protein
MPRYINLCPEPKKKDTPKQKPHYHMYRDSYKWYEENRKEFRKDYNEMYRELKDGDLECECGSVVKELSIYAHRRSKKHLAYLLNAEHPPERVCEGA